MHDAFEHAVILEKLPLQIECIATFGKKSVRALKVAAILSVS